VNPTPTNIRDRLIDQRVVPVLRLPTGALTEQAVDCLVAAGFGCVEITMTTPDAIDVISRLVRMQADVTVGAGTVLDTDTARRCLDAGATFIVTPCVVPGVAAVAHAAGAAALIGGFTPSEIYAAHREGADIVKVFPVTSAGPEHVRALHAVFPQLLLCPTGGVTRADIEPYLHAGAALVGVGNDIVDRNALNAGDRAQAIAHARAFLEGAKRIV
jgi:2-dehydro-3-deoxyphosphogluconate aldolase / (4S)-4-hydroxy-2-oxoglutarate aldolase